MYKKFTSKTSLAICTSALLTFTSFALADNYYRWYDAQGGVHYGSTPPQGVEAEKVKVYAGKGTPANQAAPNTVKEEPAVEETPEEAAKKQQLRTAQKQDCDDERKRLKSLQANRPIRMTKDDGSSKYLSKEEIAEEIRRSNEYLKDVCP